MLKELTDILCPRCTSGARLLSKTKILLVSSGVPAGASNTRTAIVLMIVDSGVVVPRNQIWVDTKTFPTLS